MSEQERDKAGACGPPAEEERGAAETVSLVVFRLGAQWLALSTQVVREVTQVCTIRSIPQRNAEVLLGLLNLRGELQLCVSLKGLLGLNGEYGRAPGESQPRTARLVVIEKEDDCWVFPADEVLGVFHFAPSKIQQLPTTPTEGAVLTFKGRGYWQEKQVSYLDETVLFDTLKRRIS
ncbi:MAG: chemotaxis protein CheW [Deltaproteobacteria bacterium]|nr:chemotaxis protein CheW [Deltaproteobacteria bacterium]